MYERRAAKPSGLPGTGGVHRFHAVALAAMYAAGAALGLAAVAVPHGTGVNELAWAVNSALGFPVALALYLGRRQVRVWMLHTLLLTGAAMVALGMLFGNGGPASVATSFFYVWVALYVSWFFSVRVTVAHLVIDGILFAAVLDVGDAAAGPAVWLLVMGTAAVVSIVVMLMHRELLWVANLDSLTGLPTRPALTDALTREVGRSRRTGSPFCLVILDVDGLKAVNDQGGHQAGDAVLADSARAWRAALRDTDLLVRFGGDEFVAILPSCPPEDARAIVERLRAAAPSPCSIGWAAWCDGETPGELLERADVTLYEAKRANRVSTRLPGAVRAAS